ncbi:DNA repair protein XRCC2 [Misgurnus anguillicaudatus]|uniref:DNA repair protein XRCC2 n=1 Tax=Misgurnus anguillicaudatus TaxID=75329 RepID=UPI002435655D|nr:DNA repair protein XRCC2 [Misgurnus anguillicaudatus]
MTARVRMAENGAQVVSRLEGRQSLKNIESNIFPMDCGPRQGDIVEFNGMEGTGKTETLYHLITRCIMPVQSGGLEVGVVFIDTDYHFDMLRLVSILEGRLDEHSKEGYGCENEPEEVCSCLRRLSVVHCNSSAQLLLTLHYLENSFTIQSFPALLVIDSISAFYWVDRYSGGDSIVFQEANLKKCTNLLDKLRKNYGIVIFATTHAIMRNYGTASDSGLSDVPGSSLSWRWKSVDSATDFNKPYLCRAWQRIVTHRLLFTKSHVSNDHKQVFSTACTSIMTKGVKKCLFVVIEDGIKYLCDK